LDSNNKALEKNVHYFHLHQLVKLDILCTEEDI